LVDSDAARPTQTRRLCACDNRGRRGLLLPGPRAGVDRDPGENPAGDRNSREQPMKLRKSLLFILLALPSLFVSAHQQPQPAGQSRGGRSAEEYIKLLESERRIEGLQVAKVVDALKVRPDDRVCDLGAGSGLFTRPLARKAGGKGVVYAVDINDELLKHVERTAQEQKLANIKPILASETDPKLPEPVDLITIIDTLHHIGNRGD